MIGMIAIVSPFAISVWRPPIRSVIVPPNCISIDINVYILFTDNNVTLLPTFVLLPALTLRSPVFTLLPAFSWAIVERIKKISGTAYISSKKCWYINESEFDLTQFKITIGDDFVLNLDKFKVSNKKILPEIQEVYLAVLKRKRYSECYICL